MGRDLDYTSTAAIRAASAAKPSPEIGLVEQHRHAVVDRACQFIGILLASVMMIVHDITVRRSRDSSTCPTDPQNSARLHPQR